MWKSSSLFCISYIRVITNHLHAFTQKHWLLQCVLPYLHPARHHHHRHSFWNDSIREPKWSKWWLWNQHKRRSKRLQLGHMGIHSCLCCQHEFSLRRQLTNFEYLLGVLKAIGLLYASVVHSCTFDTCYWMHCRLYWLCSFWIRC